MLPLVYHHNYSCPFPEKHRFVMSKFRRLYDYLKTEDIIERNDRNVFSPQMGSVEDFAKVHCPQYLNNLLGNEVDPKEWRRVGLPWSQGLVDRTLTAPNGTLLSAQLALKHGIACHLAGGTHHAHFDFGSGFCMLNDLAYAAKSLVLNQDVERVLIFDCDVHQGDGTAKILEHDEQIFTCSIHCEKNFPFRKSVSDLDIGLELYMEDKAYLDVVSNTLERLLYQFEPDVVLYDAGVDIWEHDSLGKLNITWEGMAQRDHRVLETCLERGTPIATVIGGGYDEDHARLARRHAIVVEQAHHLVNGDNIYPHQKTSPIQA